MTTHRVRRPRAIGVIAFSAIATLAVVFTAGCAAPTHSESTAGQPLSLVQATPTPSVPQVAPPADQTAVLASDAQSAPGGGAVPVGRSVPNHIVIPAIGVDSDLIGLGLQADGTMEVPVAGFPGGWYTGSPTPGEVGPAVVAGHVDWGGEPGIFYGLEDLAQGDRISITRQDGSVVTFAVTGVAQYAKSDFPTATVYGDIDHSGLRLITCGGTFDSDVASYDDNIVVYADLVN